MHLIRPAGLFLKAAINHYTKEGLYRHVQAVVLESVEVWVRSRSAIMAGNGLIMEGKPHYVYSCFGSVCTSYSRANDSGYLVWAASHSKRYLCSHDQCAHVWVHQVS